MKALSWFVILMCVFSLIACKGDSTGPSKETPKPFSLKILVLTPEGTPRSGLRISLLNQVLFSPSSKSGGFNKITHTVSPLATSTLRFEVPVVCKVDLTAFEMDGSVAANYLTDYTAVIGSHVANFSINGAIGSRVYKLRLTARDMSSGAILFMDSIYAALVQQDASLSLLGSTGLDGSFETRDTLRFPNLLSLPPLILTDATSETQGTFSFRDTVTVMLTDTVSNTTEMFAVPVMKAAQLDTLVWTHGLPRTLEVAGSAEGPSRRVSRINKTVFMWRLDQNYPNPFD